MSKSRDEQLSRSLSWVLRHQAKALGLSISSDGYIAVADVLACHKRFRGFKEEDVRRVVENCPKQRYKLSLNSQQVLCIRANQGHSIKSVQDKELLKELSSDELMNQKCVVHGTNRRAWKDIQKCGALSRMTRKHMHFATGLPNEKGVVSGMRKGSEVHIYLDVNKCAEDSIIFYQSDNNVLLTAGKNEHGLLPLKYFAKVIDVEKRINVLL